MFEAQKKLFAELMIEFVSAVYKNSFDWWQQSIVKLSQKIYRLIL